MIKAAIVTGSSRGIGRAIALRLARNGIGVVLCARDQPALTVVEKEIESEGGMAAAIALDLRDSQAARRLVQFTLDRFGRIDILVNNAGATKRGDFLALTDEDWSDGYALKLFGAVRLTRDAWPWLKSSSGSLINIAGIGGRTARILKHRRDEPIIAGRKITRHVWRLLLSLIPVACGRPWRRSAIA